MEERLQNLTTEATTTIQQESGLDKPPVSPLEGFQKVNLICASVLGLVLHIYIAHAVLKRRLLHDKYMVLTYLRSYIDAIFLICVLYLQEVFILVPHRPEPKSFLINYDRSDMFLVQELFIEMRRLAQQLQILLVMMCVIHRFLLFIRPGAIPHAYAVFTMFCMLFCIITGLFITPNPLTNTHVYTFLVLTTLIMSMAVHTLLQRHFTAHKYSLTVCEIQNKTSKFLLYLILIYSVPYVFVPLLRHVTSGVLFSVHSASFTYSPLAISRIVELSLQLWLPLFDGWLSLWSVRGLLSTNNGANTSRTRVSAVMSSESESRC